MATRLPLDVRLVRAIEPLIFARRPFTLALLALLTALLGWQASQLTITAAGDREVARQHLVSRADASGPSSAAEPIRIALVARSGDLYNAAFLFRLKTLANAVGAMPGIDSGSVRSLFSPELRYVEVVEGAYRGASIVPDDFNPAAATREQVAKIRASVANADLIGQYVTTDLRGALIEALPSANATAAERSQLPRRLESAARAVLGSASNDYSVAVGGAPSLSAALVAELPSAAMTAAAGFAVTVVVLMPLLGSMALALLVSVCALVAAIWQLGLLKLAGSALDPQAAVVVVVTIAAAVLQGAQLAGGWRREAAAGGRSGFEASLQSWRRLAIPAATAVLAAAAASLALFLIGDLPLLRQSALAVTLGLAAVVVVNGSLLPLLLSRARTERKGFFGRDLLQVLVSIGGSTTAFTAAIAILIVAAVVFGGSAWKSRDLAVASAVASSVASGAAGSGSLSPQSRYPAESATIVRLFPRSEHQLTVDVDAAKDSCTRSEVVEQVDRLAWQIGNVPGITGTRSLPQEARRVLTAFSEGSPKFRVLARNRETLTQAIAPIPAENGLFNADCSRLPVQVFLADEKPATLAGLAERVAAFNAQNAAEFYETHKNVDAAYCALQRKARNEPASLTKAQARLDLSLACPVNAAMAGGPAGQRLASRAVLASASERAMIALTAALALAVWLMLADAASVIAILLPSVLAGVMLQALMALAGIPVTAVNLPLLIAMVGLSLVANLLMFSELRQAMATGIAVAPAWTRTLDGGGRALFAASMALMAGLLLWLGASTGFQRQTALLMIAVLGTNLIGSLLLLPAIGRFLLTERKPDLVVPRY